jgi:hypothetical protein
VPHSLNLERFGLELVLSFHLKSTRYHKLHVVPFSIFKLISTGALNYMDVWLEDSELRFRLILGSCIVIVYGSLMLWSMIRRKVK